MIHAAWAGKIGLAHKKLWTNRIRTQIFVTKQRSGENMKVTPYLLSLAAALLAFTAQANPNHLEPIPAYDRFGYDHAVFQSLIGDDPGELWMIGKPSFGVEYAVVLRHEVTYANPEEPFDRKIASEKWVIERVEAKKHIWNWKEFDDGRMGLDIHVTKDLFRHRSEVTKEFAAQMFAAWKSVLRRTRYPDESYRGLDGTTFQFYCKYDFFGEIWTPRTGLPSMLTDLGHLLSDVATASEDERTKALAGCVELAKMINAETQKPQVQD